MDNEKSTFDNIIDDAQEYFNAKQELATLKVAEKSSKAISAIASRLLLLPPLIIAIVFASIALGFALTRYFGSPCYGFLGVSALYLLLFLLLFINREKWLATPMMNTIIKSFFNNDSYGKN